MFKTELDIRPLPSGEEFVVLSPLVYYSERYSIEVTVPPGSSTDLASIPKFLRSFITPLSKSMWAAVVHDYIVRSGVYPRTMGDWMFLDGMKEKGVPATERWVQFAAVRVATLVKSLPFEAPKWLKNYLGIR